MLLPTTDNNLKPYSGIKQSNRECIDPGTSKDLRRLQIGDTVRIQPSQGREWKEATVSAQAHQRSFEVTTHTGQRYRRNRQHLRLSKPAEHHVPLDKAPVRNRPPSPAPPAPQPVTAPKPTQPAQSPSPGTIASTPRKSVPQLAQSQQQTPMYTRSGRQVKPVKRLDI